MGMEIVDVDVYTKPFLVRHMRCYSSQLTYRNVAPKAPRLNSLKDGWRLTIETAP